MRILVYNNVYSPCKFALYETAHAANANTIIRKLDEIITAHLESIQATEFLEISA